MRGPLKRANRARIEMVQARVICTKLTAFPPTPEVEREPKPVPDLMEALERTLQNVRAGDPPRAEPDDEDDGRDGLAKLDRNELYERAQKEKIRGRTKMSKKQLVDALSEDES